MNEMDAAFARTRSKTEQCSEDVLRDGDEQGSSRGSEGCHTPFSVHCMRIPRIGFQEARRPAPLEEAVSEAHLIVPRNTYMISIDERKRKEI